MRKILIIEDDAAIVRGLESALCDEHYEVLVATDGEQGFLMAKRENLSCIILDIMLPQKNGTDICRDLRNEGNNVPILMLTSKREEMDKVLGLELGADDYVTKPFSLRELLSRIRALLRRPGVISRDLEEYAFGDVYIHFKRLEASRSNQALKLSSKEFEVLKFLIRHEGDVVSRDMLLDEVWGYESFPTTRTVDNFILSLRKKIEEDYKNPKHLLTVHTAGYKFVK